MTDITVDGHSKIRFFTAPAGTIVGIIGKENDLATARFGGMIDVAMHILNAAMTWDAGFTIVGQRWHNPYPKDQQKQKQQGYPLVKPGSDIRTFKVSDKAEQRDFLPRAAEISR